MIRSVMKAQNEQHRAERLQIFEQLTIAGASKEQMNEWIERVNIVASNPNEAITLWRKIRDGILAVS